MDAAVLIDQCPTLKQSQQRSAHFFSLPESTKHLPRCSECNKLATHICKAECGYLCEKHEVSIHQRLKGHQSESLIEQSKKKAASRVEQAKEVHAKLEAMKEKLTHKGVLKLKHEQEKKGTS
jgi:hypothetical protein